MSEIRPATLDTSVPAPQDGSVRNFGIEEAYVPIDITGSAVAPQDIGLKTSYRDGRQVNVPAIVTIPGEDGQKERFVVIRETVTGKDGSVKESRMSLRGLKQARDERFVVDDKQLLIADGAVDAPQPVVFSATSNDSEKTQAIPLQFTPKRRFWQRKPKVEKPFFENKESAGALITDGKDTLLIRGSAEQAVRVRAQRVTQTGRAIGRIAIPVTDVRNSKYRTPEQIAQDQAAFDARIAKQQAEYEQRVAQEKQRHLAAVFAPPEVGGPNGFQVTDASLRQAKAMWGFSNLRTVVDPEYKMSPDEIIETVRTNADVRLSIAGRFLEVLDMTYDLPNQVLRNTIKRPNYRAYNTGERMTSREYAARVALAKLDGTFQPDPVQIDPDRIDAQGWPELDNHRSVADWLITGMKPQEFQGRVEQRMYELERRPSYVLRPTEHDS